MKANDLSRREFHKLTAAAFGGVLAGTAIGCGKSEEPKPAPAANPGGMTTPMMGAAPAAPDLHVCRGLNGCKGKGKGGGNDCAGQGACATVAAHDCAGHNECRGQGGCGENPGKNECKGKGQCAVPLMDEAWTKARKSLEDTMKAAGKEVGPAPEKMS